MEDADFKKGLDEKLHGIKKEDKGDDQLFGTAAKLAPSEFAGHWINKYLNDSKIKHYITSINRFNQELIPRFEVWLQVLIVDDIAQFLITVYELFRSE